MKLLDGKKTAETIRGELARRVKALSSRGVIPGLVAVLVGENPASVAYVTSKAKAAAEVGVDGRTFRLPDDAPFSDIMSLVKDLNASPNVHGILVQLPLPGALREHERYVIEAVSPDKDVDGFHPTSLGRTLSGLVPPDTFWPATPYGVVELLARHGVSPAGKRVVIVGRSMIVGRPLAAILSGKHAYGDATVTVAHSRTPDLASVCREADVLIAAIGRPRFITREFVRSGAVVVDVGINRVADANAKKGYRIVGDVADEVADVAEWLTPVPGGVGPMTIAMLLTNTLQAAERFAEKGVKTGGGCRG